MSTKVNYTCICMYTLNFSFDKINQLFLAEIFASIKSVIFIFNYCHNMLIREIISIGSWFIIILCTDLVRIKYLVCNSIKNSITRIITSIILHLNLWWNLWSNFLFLTILPNFWSMDLKLMLLKIKQLWYFLPNNPIYVQDDFGLT